MRRLVYLARVVLDTWSDVVGLLLSDDCAACDAPLPGLRGPTCLPCARELEGVTAARCGRCSLPLPRAVAECLGCAARPLRPRIVAPRAHAGAARRLVLALKHGRRRDVALVLARAMLRDPSVREALAGADVLVPVPADAVRRHARGFDQAELLARALREAAREAGTAFAAPVRRALRRRATGTAQVGLSARARRRALRGAMRPAWSGRRAVVGRRVALVDDVVTTGATVEAAARVLRRAGAREVVVVACTRTEAP
jgi:ComF family protein